MPYRYHYIIEVYLHCFKVACNARMDIMDIVARHPGSTHDNVIFERSALSVRFENNEIAGKYQKLKLQFCVP